MNWLKLLIVALCMACSSLPKPCDPEVLNARMLAIATECRVEAEKFCPGYADMSESEKMTCPGVSECNDQLIRLESSCHGN